MAITTLPATIAAKIDHAYISGDPEAPGGVYRRLTPALLQFMGDVVTRAIDAADEFTGPPTASIDFLLQVCDAAHASGITPATGPIQRPQAIRPAITPADASRLWGLFSDVDQQLQPDQTLPKAPQQSRQREPIDTAAMVARKLTAPLTFASDEHYPAGHTVYIPANWRAIPAIKREPGLIGHIEQSLRQNTRAEKQAIVVIGGRWRIIDEVKIGVKQ
jgi:hypothetical protein